jgi:hypothetical protein
MQNRFVRSLIVTFLIGIGIGATYLLWDTHDRRLLASQRADQLASRLDNALTDLADVGAAQQAYLAPGQTKGPWMQRVSSTLQRLSNEMEEMRGYIASPALSKLQAAREGLDHLTAEDARVREYLGTDQDLMAADVVFVGVRDSIAAIVADLHDVRVMEAVRQRGAAGALEIRQARIVGGTAAVWLVGIFGLFWVARAPHVTHESAAHADRSSTREPEPAAVPAPVAASVDLSAAAGVCVDLARAADGAPLPALFARAAHLLDASGIILWMGAGEQLFAVASHGYDARTVARLGTIGRRADNATAAAWRDADVQIVRGVGNAKGAIAAPMVGAAGCHGVLAVELQNGGESNPAVQALTTILAAQLGGLIAAWPAPSADRSTVARAG